MKKQEISEILEQLVFHLNYKIYTMKQLFTLFSILFASTITLLAQAPPQGINYQAVVYMDGSDSQPGTNISGQLLTKQNISVQFSILKSSVSGTVVYKEIHQVQTDEFGMFSLIIGQGNSNGTSAFPAIDWGADIYFLKVELDKKAGGDFKLMSTQQLWSVPYSLYSEESRYAATAGNGITNVSDNGDGTITITYFDGTTYTSPILSGLTGPQGIQGPIGLQGATGNNGQNTLVKTTNEAVGTNCINGGVKVEYGLDENNNGILESTEINTSLTKYVCDGDQGIAGINGQNTIVKTSTETASANCINGGVKIEYGLDVNNNNILDLTEINIALTKYICNGNNGLNGAQGSPGIDGQIGPHGIDGVDGKNTLAKTTSESAGANCSAGGVKVEYGLDANSNNVLDATEINATLTRYICNGTAGATGTQGATGPQGLQGVAGPAGAIGTQGPIGLTGPAGATGATGTAGTNGTNGIDGKNTLAKTTTETAGINCATGGVKVEYGLDANSNNVLDVSEINATLTKYICNGTAGATGAQGPTGLTGATGPQGIQGVAGTVGAAGKNTLAKTTTETAGANCATGGVKVEYGLDANSNNVLDATEINATLTKYICNGTAGATGAQGPTGLTGATGPQGLAGPTGATGAQGPIGLTGPQGLIGATGPQGVQGISGTNGTNGTNGLDGKNTLAKTTTEVAGVNCATGGVKVEYGLDANSNNVLDATEINATLTKYICNGTAGATGAQGPVGLTGPQGLTGATGPQGVQGISGTNGTNGTNGLDGKNTLAKTTTEVAGINCATGGVKVEYGLDANSNNILDASEINATLTKYICNGTAGTTGAQGIAGTNGINGQNGLNALIKTTVEAAGANCANGGTKIETGLDANSNGILDVVEVNTSQTQFVCNGNSGTNAVSTSYPSNSIKIGFNTTNTWLCPTNVTKIRVEVWGAGGGGVGGSGGDISCMAWTGMGYWGGYGGTGGLGGYNCDTISVIPGQSYSIIVGSGGTGGNVVSCGTGETGGTGGFTSFNGIITANGGTGGLGSPSQNGATTGYGPLAGTSGTISNYIYSTSSIPTANYIPNTILTASPGFASGGSGGQECRSNMPASYMNMTPTPGQNGQNGFCVISY